MIYHPFTTDLRQLAALAIDAMFRQDYVRMTLPADWKRPRNFELPVKAYKDTPNREWRPIAILIWINEELSGANHAAEMRERATGKRKAEGVES